MSMDGTSRRNRRRAPAGGGFTMIEMMVVILILMILVTLIVSVGRYVYEDASRKQTQANQAVIIAAIDIYYDTGKEYPSDTDSPASDATIKSSNSLYRGLTGVAGGDPADPAVKAATAKINDLSSDAMDQVDDGGTKYWVFKDGYDKEMSYDADGGLGGTPVIISAGPDGDIATDADNIRSDKN